MISGLASGFHVYVGGEQGGSLIGIPAASSPLNGGPLFAAGSVDRPLLGGGAGGFLIGTSGLLARLSGGCGAPYAAIDL